MSTYTPPDKIEIYAAALAYAKGDHCGDAAFRPSPPRPVSAARAAS